MADVPALEILIVPTRLEPKMNILDLSAQKSPSAIVQTKEPKLATQQHRGQLPFEMRSFNQSFGGKYASH